LTEANLIILRGSYSNPDVIEKTINYIYRLDNSYKFCYGAWPPSIENAVSLFHQTREIFSHNTCDQQIQHLIISFDDFKDIGQINQFTNQVALQFSEWYPVCFALHDNEKHLHTHFIISTTSYILNIPPLTQNILSSMIHKLEQIALSHNIFLKKVTKNVPK
jgi:hypothetical protein